jgi:hypothetical protein
MPPSGSDVHLLVKRLIVKVDNHVLAAAALLLTLLLIWPAENLRG